MDVNAPQSPHPNLPPSEERTANTQPLLNEDVNNKSTVSISGDSALLSPVGEDGGGGEAGEQMRLSQK